MLTLPLADEYFLVAHDEYSGKPLASAEVVDTGLAGAVLGEMVLAGRIAAAEGGVVTVVDPRPYSERVTDAALGEMIKQDVAHPVRAWVEYLRDEAKSMVAPRLTQAGLVEKVQVRSILRQSIRYPAVEPLRAASPRARLRYMLDHPANLDMRTAILGGLVLATGLGNMVGAGSPKQSRDRLTQMVEFLSSDLRAICAGVDAAIAALALTVRR